MKEMNSITHTQGVFNMKKTALVVALATMLVFSMSTVAMAKIAGSPAIALDNGFVAWSTALTATSAGTDATFPTGIQPDPAQAAGPHANYTTSTIKCAVCHSTHGAPVGSFLLTKATGVGAGSSASAVCSYCHARTATASSAKVSLVMGSSTSPHSGRCSAVDGCHAQSPHGVGVSTYSLMSSKLINVRVDTLIANAITNTAVTGLTAADFAAASPNGFKVVTGYVCGQAACHTQSAFAISTRDSQMFVNGPSGANSSFKTGHPVMAAARATYVPPAGSAMVTGVGKAVAWVATDGCDSCHSVLDAGNGNQSWFPHNVPEAEVPGSGAALWMQVAADSSQPLVNLDPLWVTDGADYGSVTDGNCLKCHRNGAGNGVGLDY
jgi:hypothetical protein